MERWSIDLEKEYFKFSAAHFLIFPDGTAERLHGHNYRVRVELGAELSRFGLVLDFKMVKPVVRGICDRLDEHWIIPGEHPELRDKVALIYEDDEGHSARYTFGQMIEASKRFANALRGIGINRHGSKTARDAATWLRRVDRRRRQCR